MTETKEVTDILLLLGTGERKVDTCHLPVDAKLRGSCFGLTLTGLVHIIAEDDMIETVLEEDDDLIWDTGCLAVKADGGKAMGSKGHGVFLSTSDEEHVTVRWKLLPPKNIRRWQTTTVEEPRSALGTVELDACSIVEDIRETGCQMGAYNGPVLCLATSAKSMKLTALYCLDMKLVQCVLSDAILFPVGKL